MFDPQLLIVSDDPLTRMGLGTMLSQSEAFQVVGQVSTTNILIELEIYQPDIILWDFGWELTKLPEMLSDLAERLPILALLPSVEIYGPDLWDIGIQGLLRRDSSFDKVTAALSALLQGLLIIDPDFAPLITPSQAVSTPYLAEPLTPREMDVLQHLAEGLPNKTIAQHLKISDHTVKFHINAIFGKLNVQSRTEAVVIASRLGLILL